MQSQIRIAIDTVFFGHNYSGITRVWETILQHLNNNTFLENTETNEPIETINYEIILLTRGNSILDKVKKYISVSDDNTKQNKVVISYILIKEFNYLTMYQDVDYLNTICKSNKIDYFISTYFTYCTIIPNILMIHDMIPELFSLPKNHMWIQKDLAIKNASHFITISNITTKDLQKYYPHLILQPNTQPNTQLFPITLIHNAIHNAITNTLPATTPEYNFKNIYDDNFLNNFMKANGINPKSYIFAMTTNAEEYKNTQLITTLATKYNIALSQKLQTKIPLIFIIKQNLPNGYIVSNGILYLSNVSDSILATLYKNALCYINPSKYEGFGLPIFEAFSHNTPVIALGLPIYQELAPNCINIIDNDVDELFDKICFIHKNISNPEHIVNKRIANGYEILKQYTIQKQICKIHNLFNSLNSLSTTHTPFMNIILQSYNDSNPERKLELEYCIKANLENPYVLWIHDFGGCNTESYLPEYIHTHPKYISVFKTINTKQSSKQTNKKQTDKQTDKQTGKQSDIQTAKKESTNWITYDTAIKYSNNPDNISKYGMYWGIINCDIFLDNQSPWHLIRGQLNNGFVYAQSRNEFDILPNGGTFSKMDEQFAKLYHSNTQDGWFYKAPLILHTLSADNIGICNASLGGNFKLGGHFELGVDFELGMLGCDNAIADRLVKSGYKLINQPETFKLMHYDIARGKNSSNFMEKHSTAEKTLEKPRNKHPEKQGCYLVPNYDQLIANNANGDIDLGAFVNSMGGISNWEKYKIISEMLSSRIVINNPE